MMIQEDLDKYKFPRLRHCVSAGEPLNPEVMDRWRDATGLQIREGYGQSETVSCDSQLSGSELGFKPECLEDAQNVCAMTIVGIVLNVSFT